MLLLALLWTLLGLYNLLLPRRFFLVGSRWQLRDGERAEASDTYVLVVRIGGVIFLIAAAGFTAWHFTLQAQEETRKSISAAWEVSAYPNQELRVVNDPEVERVTDVESSLGALYGARMGLPTWKTAVVGRDPVGNLGVTVNDGDLWLAATAGSCTPGALMVHEDETSVTVAMTAISKPFDAGRYIPCYSERFVRPEMKSVIFVRVPLEEPLGNRTVLTVLPPERDDVGVLLPPFPGLSPKPVTSPTVVAPSPTP
ncbi:MAG: hypothetical protein ABI632_12855 [Pseudolysinimonas sp.]